MRKTSKKLAKELRSYSKLRKGYLEQNEECQARLTGCTIVATEIHHMKGRGIYLLDTTKFKAVCSNCHRYITDHSKQAIELGLSERRNTAVK